MKNVLHWLFGQITRAELLLYACLCFCVIVGLGSIFAQTQIGGGGSSSTTGLPGINVKSYGAYGDTITLSGGIGFPGGNDISCASCTFVAGDVGKVFWCDSGGSSIMNENGLPYIAVTPINAIVTANRITLGSAANGGASGAGTCHYGHDDTTAILAANVAFNALIGGSFENGGYANFATPARDYFPSGGYTFCPTVSTQAAVNVSTTNLSGWTVEGDGSDQTWIYLCGIATTNLISNSNSTFVRWSNTAQGKIRGISFWGGNLGGGGQAISTPKIVDDVNCYNWGNGTHGGGCGSMTGGSVVRASVFADSYYNMTVIGNNNVITDNTFLTNGVVNLIGVNIIGGGGGGGGSGLRVSDSLIDECSADASIVNSRGGCAVFTNSKDVWIMGTGIFGCTGTTVCPSLYVDATSVVHLEGDVLGQYSGGGGPSVAPGGMLQVSDSRMFGATSNFCYTAAATLGVTGIVKDEGGNTCSLDVGIATTITPGLTATLQVVTLTTAAAAAHGCHAGDIVEITGAAVAGYNGNWVVASVPSASTLTYIASTSGMANAGTGATVRCSINLSQISGGLPTSVSTHSANTFVLAVTPATSTLVGNMKPDQDIVITGLQATSSTSTVCATPPIVTFTNAVSTPATMTLTSAKTQWDNTVDSSSGFPVTMQSGTTFTATVGANTCATPPTNLALTYTWRNIINP